MKKTILLTILLLLMPFCVNAQLMPFSENAKRIAERKNMAVKKVTEQPKPSGGKMTLAMLQIYTWRLEVPDLNAYKTTEITIVKDSLQLMIYYTRSGCRFCFNRMYYFTDTRPSKFDKTKMGKANSGKYLVIATKEMDVFYYYEYVKLEGDRLYLKREFGEDWIFRRVPKGVTSGGGRR